MNGWRSIPIGSLGRVVTGKTPPAAEPEMFLGAVPFITPSDMSDDCRVVPTARFVSKDWDIKKRGELPKNAVCVVCIGATIGKICMTDVPSHTNQQLNSIIVDTNSHDPHFVYYSLRTCAAEFKARAAGAATPILNKTSFSEVEILVPDLEAQRRIGSILGAYDNLIEVNRRRIAVLEAMARRLFEEWFVRFSFPGHASHTFVDTPDGPLPEGWRYQPVDEAFDMTGGGTPSKNEPAYWERGTIPWFTPSDLTGSKTVFMDASEARITCEGLRRSSAKLFPPDCVMMTSRATLGVISINSTEATTNQGFITCFPNAAVPRTYLYYWLVQNVPVFIGHATGATFKEITKGVFKRLPFLTPAAELVSEFERLAKPLHDQIRALERSNRSLAGARDLMLPRLISGELLVPAAESQLEAAH